MLMSLSKLCLTSAFSFWLSVGALQAQGTAAEFLGKSFPDCDAFLNGVAKTSFVDEPAFFICEKYQYKPLYIYGYLRTHGREAFSMRLVKGRKTPCTGTGEIAWRARNSAASASGRFTCQDGAAGGYAFELNTVEIGGKKVLGGTIFGGVDKNGSGAADEVISADFYIFSPQAIRAIQASRN